jgi:hypothetical protein
MLTFQNGSEFSEVCKLKEKGARKMTPVMWSPVIKEELRNSIDSLDHFFKNDYFRDRFELNNDECCQIQHALERNCVCEKYQRKFFKCKKYIYQCLREEMDLTGSESEFVFGFPPGSDTYAYSTFVCGNSSAGKSYWVKTLVEANLKGKKADRRKFVYISNELTIDKTIQPLLAEKYHENVVGIDISEEAIEESELTPTEYFMKKVKSRVERAAPCVVIADDAQDSMPELAEHMRRYLTKLQRCGRHKQISVIFLLHKLNSGLWSSTAKSSCRYIVLFPRSMKNRCRKFLEDELGIPKREAEKHVMDYAQTGRAMVCRMHAPCCFLNKKLLRLM